MIKNNTVTKLNLISLFYSESESFNTGIELFNSETEHLLAATNSRRLGCYYAYTAQILDKLDKLDKHDK
jgi:GTP-sensing pleiotropic transcriptional regulator CodY